jgi:hypothetical protein
MVLCEPGETKKHEGMPMPQPRPVDPNGFTADGVYDMINEIVSSSWDSIQAQASQPTRMQRAMPVPGVTSANRGTAPVIAPAARPKPRVAFSLQAGEDGSAEDKNLVTPTPLQSKPLKPPSRLFGGHGRRFWIAATSVAATILFIAGWITLAVRASYRDDPARQPPATPPASASQVETPDEQVGSPSPTLHLTQY